MRVVLLILLVLKELFCYGPKCKLQTKLLFLQTMRKILIIAWNKLNFEQISFELRDYYILNKWGGEWKQTGNAGDEG